MNKKQLLFFILVIIGLAFGFFLKNNISLLVIFVSGGLFVVFIQEWFSAHINDCHVIYKKKEKK